ncbi:cytochrome P450 [Zopfochytrium polystomum]|nr:cytochrome P450 [Zopfochytrium polystomum]
MARLSSSSTAALFDDAHPPKALLLAAAAAASAGAAAAAAWWWWAGRASSASSTSAKHRRIPKAKGGLPLLGHAMRIQKDPVTFLDECVEKSGDLFRISMLGRDLFVINGAADPSTAASYFTNPSLDSRTAQVELKNFDAIFGRRIETIFKGVAIQLMKTKFHQSLDTQTLVVRGAIADALTAQIDLLSQTSFEDAPQPPSSGRKEIARSSLPAPRRADPPVAVIHDVLGFCTSIIARASALSFLGSALANDGPVLDVFMTYTDTAARASRLFKVLPRWLKPWYRWFARDCVRAERVVEGKLREELERRKRVEEQGGEKATDMLQMMIDTGSLTLDEMVTSSLGLILTSVLTTVGKAANAIYDLAAHPQLWNELRQEMDAVLGPEGDLRNVTRKDLLRMTKLDTFLRQSLALAAAPLQSPRVLTKDWVTPNGYFIPRNSYVALYSHYLHRTDDKLDVSGNFTINLKGAEEETDKAKTAATPSSNHLVFGSGRSACPGRFLAVIDIKLLLIALLSRYDMVQAGDLPQLPKMFPGLRGLPSNGPDGVAVPIYLYKRREVAYEM